MLQPSPGETRNSRGESLFPNCVCQYHCLYWPDTGSSQGNNCGSEHESFFPMLFWKDLFYLCIRLSVCFVFVYVSSSVLCMCVGCVCLYTHTEATSKCWIPLSWCYRHSQDAFLVTWCQDLNSSLWKAVTAPSLQPSNATSIATQYTVL